MELGMEPGMELGIERDRVKRSRKDIFLGVQRTRNRGAVLATERRVSQMKRGLERHPEMGENMEVACEEEVTFFPRLRGGGGYLFLTWRWLTSLSCFLGRGLGTVSIESHVVWPLQLGSQFSSNEN
ncbi:unnamed protein product [Sphagnum compactum]